MSHTSAGVVIIRDVRPFSLDRELELTTDAWNAAIARAIRIRSLPGDNINSCRIAASFFATGGITFPSITGEATQLRIAKESQTARLAELFQPKVMRIILVGIILATY